MVEIGPIVMSLAYGAAGGAIAGASFYWRKRRGPDDPLDVSRLATTAVVGAVVGVGGKFVLPMFGVNLPFDTLFGTAMSAGWTLALQMWIQGGLARVNLPSTIPVPAVPVESEPESEEKKPGE